MKSDSSLPSLSYRLIHVLVGPFFNILGLSCRSACELCSAQMDRPLSTSEKIRLRMHLAMCGICRHLPAQFQGLRKLVKAACQNEKDEEHQTPDTLPEETKVRIHDHLKNPDHR